MVQRFVVQLTRSYFIFQEGLFFFQGGNFGFQCIVLLLLLVAEFCFRTASFAFAGFWETWARSQDRNSLYRSCAILTAPASESFRKIHHRMPAILTRTQTETWLDRHTDDPGHLLPLLRPYGLGDLRVHPVADLVNRVSVDTPDCIEPVQRPTESGQLELGL